MKTMDYIHVIVLYKRGRDLILFDFNYTEDVIDVVELIEFHFCERHDFEEDLERRVKCIFKNFYDEPNDGEVEFIDYELI